MGEVCKRPQRRRAVAQPSLLQTLLIRRAFHRQFQGTHLRSAELLSLFAHLFDNGCSSSTDRHRVCTVRHCKAMRFLSTHVRRCQDKTNCTIPYCAQARRVLAHYTRCVSSTCALCAPTRRHRRLMRTQRASASASSSSIRAPSLACSPLVPSATTTPPAAPRVITTTRLETLLQAAATI